jgi:hypothetical protein
MQVNYYWIRLSTKVQLIALAIASADLSSHSSSTFLYLSIRRELFASTKPPNSYSSGSASLTQCDILHPKSY